MESLTKYLETLKNELGPSVVTAVKNQIDEEANKCFDAIKRGTPRSTVSKDEHIHLADTIQITEVKDWGRYGWKLDYDGYNEQGVPYSLIARSLNKGTGYGGATHHIDDAIHLLEGMDERINQKVEEALNKIK